MRPANEYETVPPTDGAVDSHSEDDNCRSDANWYVETDKVGVGHQRCYERGETKNEEDIEDITSDDISNRKGRLAGTARPHTNSEFRGTCPDGDDGETDDQRRQTGSESELGRSPHETFRANDEQSWADNEENHRSGKKNVRGFGHPVFWPDAVRDGQRT